MAQRFDAATLATLREAKEVRIRTGNHPDRGIVIWVVVVGDGVFVRSFRGPKAGWYKAVLAGGNATLQIDDLRIDVRGVAVADHSVFEVVSKAYLAKYPSSPYTGEMVRPEILPTTLRLDPA